MNDLSKDLFVTYKHIRKLTGKSVSSARNDLRQIRLTYGIIKPKRATRDHVCFYFDISLEHYIRHMQEPDN